MAKISQKDYPVILQRVRVEGVKVAEVAKQYGCSAANIYVILNKHKQSLPAAVSSEQKPPEDTDEGLPSLVAPLTAEVDAPVGLLTTAAPTVKDAEVPDDDVQAVPHIAPGVLDVANGAEVSSTALPDQTPPPVVTPAASTSDAIAAPTPKRVASSASSRSEAAPLGVPKRSSASSARGAGGGAKQGYGLVMRGGEAEDTTMPFRSLDDLLSSVRNIMRTAARNPEPVWFSVQPIDLADFDQDA